jgi:hypothetical protein
LQEWGFGPVSKGSEKERSTWQDIVKRFAGCAVGKGRSSS